MIRSITSYGMVACILLFAGPRDAIGANFWLSTSANVSSSGAAQAPPSTVSQTPLVNHPASASGGSLFLWARPDAGLTLNRWSLQVFANNPHVVRLIGADVASYNSPLLLTATSATTSIRRWSLIGEAEEEEGALSPGGPSYSILGDVSAFILDPDAAKGIGPQSIGGTALWKDPFYRTNDAWLLGRIDYRILSEGMSDIWLSVGQNGISHAGGGVGDTSVTFGAASESAVSGRFSDEYNLSAEVREARISVSTQHPVVTTADFNYDGDVDGADFLAWQRNLSPATGALRVQGDATGDGKVDAADLGAWKSLFRRSPQSTPAAATVPEPATLVLALVCAALALMRRNVTYIALHSERANTPRLVVARELFVLIPLLAAWGGASSIASATLWWTGDLGDGGWQNRGNWSVADNSHSQPGTGSWNNGALLTNNTLVFNVNDLNGGSSTFDTYLNGQRTIDGMRQFTSRNVNINPGSGGPLRIGSGGINTGVGPNGRLTLNARVDLTAPQTWSISRQLFVENQLSLGFNTLFLDITNTGAESRISSVISGPGSIVKSGAGEMRFGGSNANTFTGYTEVTGGTLLLNKPEGGVENDYGASVGTLYIRPGGTVRLGASSQIRDATTLGMTGGVLDLNGYTERVQSAFIDNAQLVGSGNSTWAVNAFAGDFIALGGSGHVAPTYLIISGTTTIDAAPNANASIHSVIADWGGAGGFNKTGTGILTLGGGAANSHTGAVTVNAGTLVLAKPAGSSGNDFGSAVGNLTINNASLVTLAQNWQIRDAASVYVTGGSWLNLNGFSERARLISLNNGHLIGGGASTWLAGAGDAIESINTSTISASNVALAGQIPFNVVGGTLSISGAVGNWGGAGGINKIGAGTLVLSGANSYTGTTSIGGGSLRLGNHHAIPDSSAVVVNSGTFDLNGFSDTIGSLAGSGAVTLGGGALVVGQNNATTTFSGTLSGAGSLIKVGSGTLTLSGSNSHQTMTRVDSGTLAISSDANLGASSASLAFNGGTLQMAPYIESSRSIALNAGATIETHGFGDMFHGPISGGASLTKTGGGDLWLTNTGNNYSGGTFLNGGRLFSRTGSLGSGRITFNGGELFTSIDAAPGNPFSSSAPVTINSGGASINTYGNTATLSGPITGVGGLHKTGYGKLVIPNTNNSYSGNTTVSIHEIVGNSQSIKGSITFLDNDFDKAVFFEQPFDGTFANNITGDGYLRKKGAGKLSLWGDNTYQHGTYIDQGTLIGDSASFGSNLIDIAAGASLVFQQNVDGEFAHRITGQGVLTKTGAGRLTLLGASDHTGGTIVDAGKLVVNGSLAGPIQVNAAGVLGGRGTINGSVSGPGRVAPGNSPGILTINGDYTQDPNGVLQIEIGGLTPGNTDDNHDQVVVSGTATLAGAYEFPIYDDFVPALNDEITFLTAGSVVGAPDPAKLVSPNLQDVAPGLGFRVIRNATDVRLRFVTPSDIVYVDNTMGTDPTNWHVAQNWLDASPPPGELANRVPKEFDDVNLSRTVFSSVDHIDVKDANAVVHALTVSDQSSSIAVGVMNGKTLQTATGDVTIGQNGTIQLDNGTLATPHMVKVENGGRLAGDGLVMGDVSLGEAAGGNAMLTPGVTVGDLTISGDYAQNTTGELVIDVDGATDNDTLDISGVADLGGTIKFNVLNSNIPIGVEQPFLTAGTLANGEKFQNIEIAGASNLYFNVSYQYGSSVAVAEAAGVLAATSGAGATYSCYVIGDMNMDGSYNAGDAEQLAKFFVSRRKWVRDHRDDDMNPDDRSANIDGLHGSDFDDLQAFLNQFPEATQTFVAAYNYYSAAIPEPSSATLAAIVLAALAVRRRVRSGNERDGQY